MSLADVVVLAASGTTRSAAYLEAMAADGLRPRHVILFGRETVSRIQKGVTDLGAPTTHIPTGDVNDPAVDREVRRLKPRLVVYSGYGGQIVGKALLATGLPFLHIHSGWLPEYRGSTTIYYGLLRDRSCGVSAILLSPQIDMGTIVRRKRFPRPPKGSEVDHGYDDEIRARLLVEVLQDWARRGGFAESSAQRADEGTVYYVIHPVLKHLALLSL